MKARLFVIVCFTACPFMLLGQNDKVDILNTIQKVFNGMASGDSAEVHSAFYQTRFLLTIVERDGKTQIEQDDLRDFLLAVAKPHSQKWSEVTWDEKIEIDGNYAQVWANYAFFLGKSFSHCGVDAFQLVKVGTEWKIFYLADTRRKTGCTVPNDISRQFTQ